MINLGHEIPVKVDRSDQDLDLSFETDNEEVHNTRVESEENPLDVYRTAANETAPLIILILGMNLQLYLQEKKIYHYPPLVTVTVKN